jgi:hypothetical protein
MKRNTDPAEFAEARTIVPDDQDAQPATSESIDLIQSDERSIESQLRRISGATPRNEPDGSETTESTPGSTSPTSNSSERPSSGSTERWKKPRTVREFAAQTNTVATALLNGEMNLDIARTYSSLARGVAQMMSIEVTRARFLKTEPILEFDEGEDDEPR